MRRIWAVLAIAALAMTAAFAAQDKDKDKKKGEPTRSVQGAVSGPDGKNVEGAVVFLKNVKTLQVISFITKEGGVFIFHGLNPNIDYELRAESKGLSSSDRTLSSFDTRAQAVVNLKLNPAK